jgi:hypothetical protein
MQSVIPMILNLGGDLARSQISIGSLQTDMKGGKLLPTAPCHALRVRDQLLERGMRNVGVMHLEVTFPKSIPRTASQEQCIFTSTIRPPGHNGRLDSVSHARENLALFGRRHPLVCQVTRL